jgi:hypothetical protein
MPPGAAQPTPTDMTSQLRTLPFRLRRAFNAPRGRAAALDSSMYRSFSKKENGFPHSQPLQPLFLRKILTPEKKSPSYQNNREARSNSLLF